MNQSTMQTNNMQCSMFTSRKHTYIILTPLNTILCSKAGVYRSIHHFSYFCSTDVLTSTHNLCFEQKYEKYQKIFIFGAFPFRVVIMYTV